MPGKSSPTRPTNFLGGKCFNEAPAICRGNLRLANGSKPFPISFNEAPAICRGNPFLILIIFTPSILASMRPRLYAGEIGVPGGPPALRAGASMRPRLYAGEIGDAPYLSLACEHSFNEAPAICRGNPTTDLSMEYCIVPLQ